jgi:hypothetical protein
VGHPCRIKGKQAISAVSSINERQNSVSMRGKGFILSSIDILKLATMRSAVYSGINSPTFRSNVLHLSAGSIIH